MDRIIAGWCALLMRPDRIVRSAIVLRPSTLLHFHHALVKRKYRVLFSPKHRSRPGPKGPSKELTDAFVEMKWRIPNWGCPRIAQQITLSFGIQINKDVVRRILGNRYDPERGSGGPSWLTFIGHMKDSLWSLDLFRCESAALRAYWVLVVMDQFTRRIIGFGIQRGIVDGLALCRMFNQRFDAKPYRNMSARITIHCIDFINGKRICGCWTLPKSKPCRTCHYRIHSWSD